MCGMYFSHFHFFRLFIHRGIVESQFMLISLSASSIGFKVSESILVTGGGSKNKQVLQVTTLALFVCRVFILFSLTLRSLRTCSVFRLLSRNRLMGLPLVLHTERHMA
jgi:hypothetical protein